MGSLLQTTLNTRYLREGCEKYVRSDVPAHLNDEDIQWLLDHNVRTVVDLRALDEAAKKPCLLEQHPDFDYRHMPVSTGDITPHCREDVRRSYLTMADGQMDSIIEFVEHAPTNVLYFCNAGKDRTGVLSALLLRRMGASREEIIQNFLITADNLKEMLAEFVAARPDLRLDVVTPQAWYMEAFLDGIEAREKEHH